MTRTRRTASGSQSDAGRAPAVALLVVLVLIWAGMLFGALAVVRHLEQSVVNVAGEGLARSAAAVAESVSRVLFEHRLLAKTIAETPVVRSGPPEAIGQYLRSLKSTLPEYLEVHLTDPSGAVVGRAGPLEGGAVPPPPNRVPRIEEPNGDAFDAVTGAIVLTSPILAEEGRLIGTVHVHVGLQSLQFILDAGRRAGSLASEIGTDVEYRLIDRSGVVLAEVAAPRRIVGGNLQSIRERAPIKADIRYSEEQHPQRRVPVVTGHARVTPYGPETGWQWFVTARVDRERVLVSLHRLLKPVLVGGVIAFAVLLAFFGWLASYLKARLQHSPEAKTNAGAAPVLPASERAPRRTSGTPALKHATPTVAEAARPRPGVGRDMVAWESLKRWVRLAEVHRVALFRQQCGEDEGPWISRRYEWIGRGEVVRTEWSQWFSWSMRTKGFGRWETLLANGKVIAGSVESFPPLEAAALGSCGIRTVLVVPLFVHGGWWGFMEFDHCLQDRTWSEGELQALRNCVQVLETAISEARDEDDLELVLRVMDAALESTADGLLVIDGDGRVVTFNQRLVAMWKITDAVVESRHVDEFTDCMMRHLKVPELFLRTLSELHTTPDAESYDILELSDGRLIERVSTPRRDAGRLDGRTWTFRELANSTATVQRPAARPEERTP